MVRVMERDYVKTVEVKVREYPNMCQKDHVRIGFSSEECPLCLAIKEINYLKGRVHDSYGKNKY